MQENILRFIRLLCFAQLSSIIQASRFGINIETTRSSNTYTAEEVVNLVGDVRDYLDLATSVASVRLQHFDASLQFLIEEFLAEGTATNIYLTVPNSFLSDFESSALPDLVSTIERIQELRSDVEIAVSVGDEPFLEGFAASTVSNAIEALKSSTVGVDVTVSLNYQIMNVSFPVEQGTFDDNFVSEYRSTLDLLDFFSIRVDPFFTLGGDPSITLELTAGEDMGMLTQQIEALQTAFGTIDYDRSITVSATRWPSSGNSFATPENSFQYLSNVAKFAQDESKSASLFDTLYCYELIDQNKRPDEFQQNSGMFDIFLQPKVTTPTSEPTPFPTSSPVPSEAPTSRPTSRPSPLPSPLPTTRPTPLPTSIPIAAPTSSPSDSTTATDDTEESSTPWLESQGGLISLSVLGVLLVFAIGLGVSLLHGKVKRDEKLLKALANDSFEPKYPSPSFLGDGSVIMATVATPSALIPAMPPATPRRAFITNRKNIGGSFSPPPGMFARTDEELEKPEW